MAMAVRTSTVGVVCGVDPRRANDSALQAISCTVASRTVSITSSVPLTAVRETVAAEGVEIDKRFLSRVFHGRRGGGDGYPRLATAKPVKEDTVLAAGRTDAEVLASLAVRAWRTRGDADRAEELYVKALQLAPENSTIQANYAEFLWQCDV